ncbi:MAG: ATP-binding cassette domain-containing protein [Thermoprotei archaeon]
MLEIRSVDVVVGGRRVVSNISMVVRPRELHVIIGPNGSGKTSLLNAVMGIKPYEIVRGSIIFEGSDITLEPPHVKARKGIVVAYQIPPVIKGLVTRRFVEELMKRFNVESSYAETLSEILDVKDLFSRYLFDKMSGGEKKRLETFLTLLTKPKIALLDEPDSGVDIESLNKMSEALKVVLGRGASIVLVTHSLHMLKLLREHITAVHMLYGGTVMYSGLYDEIVPYVEKYGFSGALNQFVKAG